MDIFAFEETQKQNAEYEQMIVYRKAKNRAQFEKDLKDQIDYSILKNELNKKQIEN